MSNSPRKLTIGLLASAWIGLLVQPALSEEIEMTAGAPFAPIFSWVTALPEAVVKPANDRLAEAGVDLTIDWTEAYGGVLFRFNDTLEAVELRISLKSDSDFAKSRTAVSLMSGQSGGSGPRVPCCVHG